MTLDIEETAAQFCLKRPASFWLSQPVVEVCFHATVSLISVRVGKASASYNLSHMTAVQVVPGLDPHLRARFDDKAGRIFSFADDMPLPAMYAVERRLWDWLADHLPARTPAAAPLAALDSGEEHMAIGDPTLAYLSRYAQTAVAQGDGALYLYPARVGNDTLADDIRRVLSGFEVESPWYPRWLTGLTRQLIDACQIDLVAAYHAAPPSLRGRIHALVAPD